VASLHSSRRFVAVGEHVLILAAYVGAALLRLVFPFTEHGASWVWLPSGVGLAALLLRGRSRWPGLALGSFVAAILTGSAWTPAIVAALYAPLEALLATAIIERAGSFDRGLGSVEAVIRLFLAALAASAVTASVGAWNVTMLSGRSAGEYGSAWVIFFVGDLVGMMALAPPLLVWGSRSTRIGGGARQLEFLALLISAAILGALVFASASWPMHLVLPVLYLSFPLMVWSAFRFGQPGVTSVSVVLGLLAVAGSAQGLGPFGLAANRGEALLLGSFMSVVGVTALILAAVVHERTQAQAHQRSMESRFRAFMQFSPAIAYMKAADGTYVFGNDAWARQFNSAVPAVLGRTDYDLWPRETADRFRASDLQMLQTGNPSEVTEMGPGIDGLPRWWTTLKFPVEQEGDVGRLIGGITIDVTPRLRVEQALRASEDRYRSLVELASSVIVMIDGNGAIVEFNRAAEALFGMPRDRAAGHDFLDTLVPAAARDQVRADFARVHDGQTVRDREIDVPAQDGTLRSFLWNASRLADGVSAGDSILVIGQDISELRRLETQLLLSQRMESIGRLAGGIAHDFNNLLTAILGHAEMARTDVAPGDPAQTNIAEITRAAQRAADLTRQLLAFARRQIIEPRIVDLNGLVLNVDRMLRRLLGEDIELATVPDPRLWRVRIDPGQFEQVLVNLAVNARDAMPEGGRLLIETSNVVLDADFARNYMTVLPGPHVLLAVSDTGVGMDQDVLAHIFEPFFTTKDVGKGTGLGLATCYGIVKQNRGSIWVYSERGRGTTFKIYLPRAENAGEVRESAGASAFQD
jgi:PAS domain S-box-containing protein